jgi:hypothetical protein
MDRLGRVEAAVRRGREGGLFLLGAILGILKGATLIELNDLKGLSGRLTPYICNIVRGCEVVLVGFKESRGR